MHIGQSEAQQAEAKRAEQAQLVQDLIEGKIVIPNEIVGYLISELKEAFTEKRAVYRNLQQSQAVLEQSQKRMMELNGAIQKFIQGVTDNMDGPSEDNEKRIITPATIPQPIV